MRGVLFLVIVLAFAGLPSSGWPLNSSNRDDKVDYINPYMGNISHLLVPTYPTVHLPNSMLRVYPERKDFTSEVISGLPLVVTSHRGSSAFNLSPMQGEPSKMKPVTDFTYDQERILPYYYEVVLDQKQTKVKYALSHQSGIYQLDFTQNEPIYLTVNSRDGQIAVVGSTLRGYQNLVNHTRVYIYMEINKAPLSVGILNANGIKENKSSANGKNSCVWLNYGALDSRLLVRYGISFISEDQAKANLYREQQGFDLELLARKGRAVWNDKLSSIDIEGDKNSKTLFYTSMYRCLERPVCISEDGRYYSAFDGAIHDDEGVPFYTDDWIWDTYRATHPLRILTDAKKETNIINSFLRMAKQMGNDWMPTFPEITGDSRRMNSNHAVATVIDAVSKGVRGFDLEYAYLAAKKGIEEKTLAPWSGKPAGELDRFYKEHGYIPALPMDVAETIPEVHSFEKRQPVAVTLGTAYDQWCLSEIARSLGKKQESEYYLKCSFNYRNLYNPDTQFFHPKDKNGAFITPFDYRFPGGMGAREYYGENNGWVYRWDVPHNIPDLINLMGGSEAFEGNLDQTYRTDLGKSKYEFYAQLPDHTGNVGQFSMANEPSLHIPYLYNFSGSAWKTQKKVHSLVDQWFRNDLMGIPGDEDGGGMSAFVVFTMMGFYPITPGLPQYTIGSPFLPYVKINLSNGNVFKIIAKNYSHFNKYIQSATLNGRPLTKPFIQHDQISCGGKLVFVMGDTPNKSWGK